MVCLLLLLLLSADGANFIGCHGLLFTLVMVQYVGQVAMAADATMTTNNSCLLLCSDLTPAEGHSARAICTLLNERLVEFTTRARMDLSPAVLAVVLQTGHIGAEEWSKFAATSGSTALVTHLVIQYIGLNFHLQVHNNIGLKYNEQSSVNDSLIQLNLG